MAARSYNSVGAGVTPKLGGSSCCDVARPGGRQDASSVKVTTDLPKAGRPGGQQRAPKGAGPDIAVARPGGVQTAHRSGSGRVTSKPAD